MQLDIKQLLQTNTTARIAAIAATTVVLTHLPWMLQDVIIAGGLAWFWPRSQKVPN